MLQKLVHLILIATFLLTAAGPMAAQAAPAVTVSPAPSAQQDGLQVWVDESLDLASFSPFAAFILHFGQPMDPASSATPLLAYPYTDGQPAWDAAYTTLTFTPQTYFTPGQSITFFLDPDLRSQSGERFPETQYWPVSITPGPQVISRLPSEVNLRDLHPTIEVTFNQAMDQASVASALSVQPEIAYTLAWDQNTLQIILSQALSTGTRYSFTIAASAHNPQGSPLFEDYSWEYWVPPLEVYVIAPSRLYANPRLGFSHAIDPVATGTPFLITPPLEGEWKWTANTQALFTNSGALDRGTIYTITITGDLYDLDGNILEPTSTAALTFNAGAPITSVSPIDGGSYANPSSTIRVYFSIPVDHASAEAALQIEPPVIGAFNWQSNTMVFDPDPDLEEYTDYTVTLSNTVTDTAGKAVMVEPYIWTFTSGHFFDPPEDSESPNIFSVWGPNIQVVDASGARLVQFMASSDHPNVTFNLYSFELGAFVKLYTEEDYEFSSWNNTLSIDSQGLEPAFTWEATYTRGIQEMAIPAEVPAGLYVVNMTYGSQIDDQLFVVLTDNTLVVKRAGDDLFIWASDINGASVPGLEVRLYSTRGEQLREGLADEDGVYRTTIPDGYEAMLVAARGPEGDVTLSGLDDEWASSGDYYYDSWTRPAENRGDSYVTYIFTDRPIYRPGQVVYFKAILRADEDVQYSVPPTGTPVTVQVKDGRNNVLQTIELATNAFGSIDGQFQLAEGAMLGDYKIVVTIDGRNRSQVFKVQEYTKPDIQVLLSTDAAEYVDGDPITFTVDVSYYFGQPLPNARVVIRQYHIYPRYDGPGTRGLSYFWGEPINTGITGLTDASGHYEHNLVAVFPEENYGYTSNWRSSLQVVAWGLEVTVEDGSGQPINRAVVYQVYNASIQATLDFDGSLKGLNQPFTAHVAVTSLEDTPIPGQALTLVLSRWDWRTSYDFVAADTFNLTTDDAGQAELALLLDQPGYYKAVLSGKDERNNPISFTRWLYVTTNDDNWNILHNVRLNITAEFEQYRPYETARFMVESTFSGPAILTFERGSVIHYQLVELTAPLTILEAEMIPEYGPNVFVTINAYRAQDTNLEVDPNDEDWYYYWSVPDSLLYQDNVEIAVEVVGKRLDVTITADQEVYAPGAEAEFTIQVTDEQGRPVRAEVSLVLVDEAIYALSGELSQPIFQAFYRPRNHTVFTFDSLKPTRIFMDPGGRGGGGEDTLFGQDFRSDFEDTAAWFPSLTTDANGQVTVSLTLPDNLTSWRLTARAATASTQVGEATFNVLTQQPVIVRPILPGSLVAGDQVEISAIVHNYTDRVLELDAVLAVTGPLEIARPVPQPITLQPGDMRVVTWNVTALQAGEVEMTFSAGSEEEPGDAVRLPLTIHPLAVPDVFTQVGDFQDEYLTPLVMPDFALPMSSIEIRLDRSIASSLLDGLEYLTGYPYGCVEQTMSRALPNAVVGRALFQLGVSDPALEAELPEMINASLQRLYGYQHSDGGWGWWYDDDTDDYQTAWVLFGLALIAEAGYPVEPQVIEKGAAWLTENLAEMDLRTQAYALYSLALAGQGDLPAAQALAAQAHQLDAFSQATLALALLRLDDRPGAQAILELLENSAVQRESPRGVLVFWQQLDQDGYYRQKTMSSSLRTTALVLDLIVKIDPDHELVPGIVRYLMSQRQTDGWGTTNETTFTILALTDHLLSLQTEDQTTSYRIELDGEQLAAGTLDPGRPSTQLTLTSAQLSSGIGLLHIVQEEGPSRLYFTITSRMFLSLPEVPAAGNVLVTREYIDVVSKKPIEQVYIGDLIKVKLTITIPAGAAFVIIEDYLPGGLVALNQALNTTTHYANPYCSEYYEDSGCRPPYYWQDYGYNYKEIHADRVTFFITEFQPGTITITYLARATYSGSFVAMPTLVSAMYETTIWGRSASTQFIINR